MSEKDNPKVYPVDSREHMLKPQDIFAVAAHEDPAVANGDVAVLLRRALALLGRNR